MCSRMPRRSTRCRCSVSAAAVLFSGRTEETTTTLISSMSQLGYFLNKYVLQSIRIKQSLMQLQRFFGELLIQRCICGDLTAKNDDYVGIIAGYHRSSAVLSSHANRRAVLRSPQNHRFSECNVVQKLCCETRAHEKFVFLLEAHHNQ